MAQTAFEEKEYTKRFDLGLWKRIFRYALKYKMLLGLLLGCMLITALMDTIYPLMTRHVIDHYIVPKNLDGLWGFAAFYLSIVAVFGFVIGVFILLAGKLETRMIYDIRKDGFNKLQKLSFSYFDRTPVGWLMARMTSDCERLGATIAWGIVDMVWGTALMIGITAVMLVLNWKLALITLSVVPVLVVVSLKFQKMILGAYRKVRKTNSKITGAFNEGINGAKTTKTLVREKANLREFQELTGSMYSASVRASVLSAIYFPLVLVISAMGSGLVVWFGGSGVIAGVMTYGTLVAFTSYVVQFFEPVWQIARIFAEMQNAQASAERVFSLLDTEVEIKDDTERTKGWGEKPFRIEDEIRFDGVHFAYKQGETVLRDFDLKIRAGEKIALVGETGSGKTTIVNLICRFYQPQSGNIRFDDRDSRDIPLEKLQSNIGVVLQTPHLFNGTIRDNIRYGKLDATDEEIMRALKMVNADRLIARMENGLDTSVGEGGNMLSTGEKQMLSFARAIISDPQIFILDEATSSIDTETEHLIQDAIDKLLVGRTSFLIAHRLSTIRSADRILVLSGGEIIEEGSHHDLIRLKGHYYKLYTNQFLEENEKALLTG